MGRRAPPDETQASEFHFHLTPPLHMPIADGADEAIVGTVTSLSCAAGDRKQTVALLERRGYRQYGTVQDTRTVRDVVIRDELWRA